MGTEQKNAVTGGQPQAAPSREEVKRVLLQIAERVKRLDSAQCDLRIESYQVKR